ncbi:MAG: hypothetical protein AAF938_10925 [Myxococcota bacterium]
MRARLGFAGQGLLRTSTSKAPGFRDENEALHARIQAPGERRGKGRPGYHLLRVSTDEGVVEIDHLSDEDRDAVERALAILL